MKVKASLSPTQKVGYSVQRLKAYSNLWISSECKTFFELPENSFPIEYTPS
jgi:hypothetical protein